ncbi:MAG TPA: hypothetical protein VMK12_16900 [Anaeromyxobacteraceae bacterium]|nr:hypothetical protein [Anaeromyxobacteraceae bacterium]
MRDDDMILGTIGGERVEVWPVAEVFIEPVRSVSLMCVFGAGPAGHHINGIARVAGFDVVVVDDRDAHANRFPEAFGVFCDEFDRATAQLSPSVSSQSSSSRATTGHAFRDCRLCCGRAEGLAPRRRGGGPPHAALESRGQRESVPPT